MLVTNDDGTELVVGAVWKIRLPPKQDIKTIKILALTPATVKFMEVPFSYLQPEMEISYIKWVYQVPKGEDDGETV